MNGTQATVQCWNASILVYLKSFADVRPIYFEIIYNLQINYLLIHETNIIYTYIYIYIYIYIYNLGYNLKNQMLFYDAKYFNRYIIIIIHLFIWWLVNYWIIYFCIVKYNENKMSFFMMPILIIIIIKNIYIYLKIVVSLFVKNNGGKKENLSKTISTAPPFFKCNSLHEQLFHCVCILCKRPSVLPSLIQSPLSFHNIKHGRGVWKSSLACIIFCTGGGRERDWAPRRKLCVFSAWRAKCRLPWTRVWGTGSVLEVWKGLKEVRESAQLDSV